MSPSAVCLNGEASKTGFEIIHIQRREVIPLGDRLEPGGYVWTENAKRTYLLYSRTNESDLVLNFLLNARTDNQVGAFTSEYGPLVGSTYRYRGGECSSVADLRAAASQLRELREILLEGILPNQIRHPRDWS